MSATKPFFISQKEVNLINSMNEVDCIHGPFDKEGSGEEAKVDGFDPDEKQLYIDPEECIDCGACEPECPVEAIFEESELPAEWNKYIKINYEWFGRELS